MFQTFQHTESCTGHILINKGHGKWLKIVKLSLVWVLLNVVVLRIWWLQSDRLVQHGVHWPVVVVCAGVRNFCTFFIAFVPISCFKRLLLQKVIMGCKLLKISLKLLGMLNMYQCLLMLNMYQCLVIISFLFGSTSI